MRDFIAVINNPRVIACEAYAGLCEFWYRAYIEGGAQWARRDVDCKIDTF